MATSLILPSRLHKPNDRRAQDRIRLVTDLPMLVDAILDELGDRETEMARAFASGAMLSELLRHAWPGNVRELRNYVEACIVRQDTTHAREATTEPPIDVTRPLREVRDAWVKHVERRYLEQLLLVHGGNVSAAARAAGIDRVHLHRLLVRVGLHRPSSRGR